MSDPYSAIADPAPQVAAKPPMAPVYGSSHNGGVTVQIGDGPAPQPDPSADPYAAFSNPAPPPRQDQVLGLEAGAMKPADNAATLIREGVQSIPVVGPAIAGGIDKAGEFLGLPSLDEAKASHQATITDAAAHGVVPGTAGRVAGDIAATLPLAIALRNPWIGGAAMGAADTDDPTSFSKTALSTAEGMVGGGVGSAAVSGLGKVIAPNLSPTVRLLLDQKVPLTVGQMAGGALHRIEDGLTSVPVVGDLIKSAQGRAMHGFNEAALNQVLEPIGEKLPAGTGAGHAGVAYAEDALSKAYESLLPTLTIKADPAFVDGMAKLATDAKTLPEAQFKQLQAVVESRVSPKFAADGTMSGADMKALDSDLGGLARKYAGSSDAGQREFASSLRDIQGELRDLVARSNPEQAPRLSAINGGWARLVRVQKAAGSLGAKDGVFTPSHLMGAVKAGDSSARKASFSKGEALMQDLAGAGKDVLPSTVPDSGTPLRGLLMAAAAGVAGHETHLLNPGTVAALAALAAPYTKVGQKAATAVMSAERPAAAHTVRKLLSHAKAPAVVAGNQTVRAVVPQPVD